MGRLLTLFGGRVGLGGAVASLTLPGTPLAVYGTSRLVDGYTGALFRLYRVADAEPLDISATSSTDPSPDISGVAAWLGAATYCYVDRVYDQMGSANHSTQTSTSLMPIFTLTNAVRGKYGILMYSGKYLDVPAAITADSKNFTFSDTVSYMSSNAAVSGHMGAAFNTTGALTIIQGTSAINKLQILTSTAFNSVSVPRSRSQTQVTTVTSGASAIKVYQDDTAVQSIVANNAGTVAGGKIGYTASGYSMNAVFFARAIYASELDSTNVGLVNTCLTSIFDILTGATTKLVWPGHSGVEGTGSTFLKNIQFYTEPLLNSRIQISNQGKFGQLAATIYAARASYITEYDATKSKNIIMGADPANDILSRASGTIVGYGTTVWTDYVLPFIQAMKAAGFTVVQQTMIGGNWAPDYAEREAERQAYNTLVRDNAVSEGYTLLDYTTNTDLENYTGSIWADSVHLNNSGYELESTIAAPVINSIL